MSTQLQLASKDSVIDIFNTFREELDDHNDRRERLIKASRDITNISKKTIFLLHRISLSIDGAQDTEDEHTLNLRAASEARERLREVQDIYSRLREELQGDRFWRYQRQVSPGLQEYIEALSFAHYLEQGSLISFEAVQCTLVGEDGVPYFPLTMDDYLLGLSDLTGELMRFAISSIARRGGRTKASQVCAFVRGCKSDFERLTPYVRELSKKQAVTSQSLQKIEDAAYAIVVRGSEYDLPPEILDDIVARSISRYDVGTRDRQPRHRDVDSADETED